MFVFNKSTFRTMGCVLKQLKSMFNIFGLKVVKNYTVAGEENGIKSQLIFRTNKVGSIQT